VAPEIQPVHKPEQQNRRQRHNHQKQPAQKPNLPLVLGRPYFSSASFHNDCRIKLFPASEFPARTAPTNPSPDRTQPKVMVRAFHASIKLLPFASLIFFQAPFREPEPGTG
jgi:hypothetical protein